LSIKRKILRILKKTFKVTAIIFLLQLFAVFTAVYFVYQSSYVQTFLAKKAAEYLSKKIDFPVDVEKVDINWVDNITIKGLRIRDLENKEFIFIQNLNVNFFLKSLFLNAPELEKATITNLDFKVHYYKESDIINVDEFIRKLKKAFVTKSSGGGGRALFNINEVELINTRFSYFDERFDAITDAFDYYHFAFDSINGVVKNFAIMGDSIHIPIEHISAIDQVSKLRVKHINTNMLISEFTMEFNELFAQINDSEVKNQLRFGFTDIGNMSYIEDSVMISVKMDSTVLRTKDLAIFFPELHDIKDTYVAYGEVRGIFTKLRSKDFHVAFGEKSHFSGKGSIDGLPDFWNSFSELDLKNSVVYANDLKQYVGEDASEVLQNFGKIYFDGEFIGFPLDFVANGKFDTDLGKLKSDINLKLNEHEKDSYYKGHLETYAFDFGKLIDMPNLFQKIDMNGEIEGSGFSLESAKLNLESTISRFGILNYDYKNIKTNATLSAQFFNGKLSVADSNLTLSAQGSVDLKKGVEAVKLDLNLEKAFLYEIKLLEDYGYISTKAKVDFKGFDLDYLVGSLEFDDSRFEYQDRELDIHHMKLIAEKDSSFRKINFKSDLFDLMAKGEFTIQKTQKDLLTIWDEYVMYIKNEKDVTDRYYASKSTAEPKEYKIDVDLKLNNVGPVLNLIRQDLYLSKNTHIVGEISVGKTNKFSLYGDFDTLIIDNNHFYGNKLDFNSSKIYDKPEILSFLYVYSSNQKIEKIDFEKLEFEGVWNENKIEFTSGIKQEGTSNLAQLAGDLSFLPNELQLKLQPSQFQVLDEKWNIYKNNKITLSGKEFYFENLLFESEDKLIAIDGFISDTTNKELNVEFRNFDLSILSPLAGFRLDGILNSKSKLINFYQSPIFNNDLSVTEFMIDSFMVGNIKGKSNWITDKKVLYNELNCFRENEKIIELEGFYNPFATREELQMNAYLYNASINIFQPFMAGVLTDMEGKANGKLVISGKLASPELKGKVRILNGKLRIDYLNTFYTFNDDVYFSENEIYANDLVLIDEIGEKAILNGGVYHDGFRSFGIDIKGNFKNALVFNIPKKDAEYYYGFAYATGNFRIWGPFEHLNITVDALTNKGTKVYIPLEGTSTIETLDYITFVNKSISKDEDKTKKRDLSGIKMNFNFEITPDAYAEIIFDQKAGDIIRGNGHGRIKMDIDTRGDFNMYGTYEIDRGAYNFTLLNVINKEFKIEKGGTITWNGDPYGGEMNINAVYSQMASFSPLVQDTTLYRNLIGRPEVTRRYPAEVHLNMTGNLMTPAIKLGINFKDYPVLLNDVVSMLNQQLQTNEQEMNRQVFSLLVLKRLSPMNSFAVSNQAVGGSLSELLTNQLSYWMSQVDENLDVSLDLNGLDQDAFNTFQLRLSYSLLDGRLRISRDGGFTNVQNTVSAATAIGDWTLEYMLTKDGKYRIKLFNKVNQNAFVAGLTNTSSTTAGASIMHTTTFDRVSELFRRRKKNIVKEDKEASSQEDDNDLLMED
jgi:hypothetical protein